MSCVAVNANENRRITHMVVLHLRRKFKGVGGYDSIIALGRSNERCWVGRTGGCVVYWRVAEQVLEHLFAFIGCAIVIRPAGACCKRVIAKHIEYAHSWERYLEKIRTLSGNGANQETAVRSAANGKALLTGVTRLDQKLGSRDEIVKYILFFPFYTCDVPGFSVLSTPSNVGYGIHAPHL